MDRVLVRIHIADEVGRIQQERQKAGQRLKRLGKAYVDGFNSDEDYRREKRSLEETLAGLVAPAIDATKEAGKLPENLPSLWAEANLAGRRKLLLDNAGGHLRRHGGRKGNRGHSPQASPLFEIATTREGSDVILINEPPLANDEPEAADLCFWWRRGRGSNSPSSSPDGPDMLQACSELCFSRFRASPD